MVDYVVFLLDQDRQKMFGFGSHESPPSLSVSSSIPSDRLPSAFQMQEYGRLAITMLEKCFSVFRDSAR